MKAYVYSVGEKTTKLCVEQLERYGFEVVLVQNELPWHENYKHFILNANEDCLRVDPDVIVNENIRHAEQMLRRHPALMFQFQTYDFYSNKLKVGQPVMYTKEVLNILKQHYHRMNKERPETWAWRLEQVNPRTVTIEELVVGLHGFYQDTRTIERAAANRLARKLDFDQEFVDKILSI